ncbi:hypothetical protein [Helicobacter pylori]|uniref:hypothetical protein n=1 Tax=Helicobacter pylori TaxID=210 RepID=UPI0018A6AF8A|nr:hypothetical protein [Helicobacter pylori]
MDSTYIKHYLDGINLLDMHLSLLANQITPPPEIENACDLGFGLGVDLNINASGNPKNARQFASGSRKKRYRTSQTL